MRGQWCELQRQLPAERKRAFRTDQQMREIRDAVVGISARVLAIEHVDVVACDTPQDFRHARHDFIALTLGNLLHAFHDLLQARALRRFAQ